MSTIETNPHFHLFETPANLFLEILSTFSEVTVSEYGDIQFFVSFGKNSKYPLTIHCPKKSIDEADTIEKYREIERLKERVN